MCNGGQKTIPDLAKRSVKSSPAKGTRRRKRNGLDALFANPGSLHTRSSRECGLHAIRERELANGKRTMLTRHEELASTLLNIIVRLHDCSNAPVAGAESTTASGT
eukprot:1307852-Pyramimonas_sp.AAC.1